MFIATTTPPIFSASPGGAAWPVRDGTMPPLRGLRRFRLGRAINMSPRWAWLALAAGPPAQREAHWLNRLLPVQCSEKLARPVSRMVVC